MRNKLPAFAFAAVVFMFTAPVHALPCTIAPFSDVSAADGNCSSVEWLKNRQITLGCAGSLFCPVDFVTRTQMALFMQRLADAVVRQPVQSSLNPGAIALTADPAANVPCTAIVAIVPYPRTLVIHAQGSFKTAAAADVGLQILYTLDGNTNNYLGAPGVNMLTTATSTSWGHVSRSGVVDIPANVAVKIGSGFYAPAGNASVTESRCTITGLIQSRTGSGTPFDQY